MHHKRRRPRTSPPSTTPQVRFPRGCPQHWRLVFMTRPARRGEKRLLTKIMHGADPDGLVAPTVGRKPHVYYW